MTAEESPGKGSWFTRKLFRNCFIWAEAHILIESAPHENPCRISHAVLAWRLRDLYCRSATAVDLHRSFYIGRHSVGRGHSPVLNQFKSRTKGGVRVREPENWQRDVDCFEGDSSSSSPWGSIRWRSRGRTTCAAHQALLLGMRPDKLLDGFEHFSCHAFPKLAKARRFFTSS